MKARVFSDRQVLYTKLEALRNAKLLVYIAGDRPGMETQIHSEVLDWFLDHLDTFNLPKKISLYLYSRGGDTLAGWGIVSLIRQFCDDFEVIVPSKAHSTATLIALGANRIIMTKQATLSSVDPSVNSPLNPQLPGAPPNKRMPVSVEAVAGFLELAKRESEIKGEDTLTSVFLRLADNVHPLALGHVYRARTQIQRLARKLLSRHMPDEEKIEKIISFVCSESGSHDYTIYRREARDELHLPVETPNDELYQVIQSIYRDVSSQLELRKRFKPEVFLGKDQKKEYEFTRILIESLSGGSDKFTSSGSLAKHQVQTPQGTVNAVKDDRTFDGWIHENASD